MKKKIMIVNGSPRKNGNTATVVEWATVGAREAGGDVEIVEAAKIENKVLGCSGCRKCNDSDEYRCVIRDETSSLVARMMEYDMVVFATPVYIGNFSAQLKMVIDRMYCLTRYQESKVTIHPAFKNVSLALIATAGGDEQSGLNFVSGLMREITAGLGKDLREFLVPFCPGELGLINSDTGLQAKAIAFGKSLVK